MPIYEYRCESCSEVFEALQTMSAAPPEQCPKCDGQLERLYSPTSLNFGGFTSRTDERRSKRLTVEQQAKQEQDRLVEHSKKTGVSYNDLFEDHEHQ